VSIIGEQIPLDISSRAETPTGDMARKDGTIDVASNIAYRRLAVCLIRVCSRLLTIVN
jgi:hypothetical protein